MTNIKRNHVEGRWLFYLWLFVFIGYIEWMCESFLLGCVYFLFLPFCFNFFSTIIFSLIIMDFDSSYLWKISFSSQMIVRQSIGHWALNFQETINHIYLCRMLEFRGSGVVRVFRSVWTLLSPVQCIFPFIFPFSWSCA